METFWRMSRSAALENLSILKEVTSGKFIRLKMHLCSTQDDGVWVQEEKCGCDRASLLYRDQLVLFSLCTCRRPYCGPRPLPPTALF